MARWPICLPSNGWFGLVFGLVAITAAKEEIPIYSLQEQVQFPKPLGSKPPTRKLIGASIARGRGLSSPACFGALPLGQCVRRTHTHTLTHTHTPTHTHTHPPTHPHTHTPHTCKHTHTHIPGILARDPLVDIISVGSYVHPPLFRGFPIKIHSYLNQRHSQMVATCLPLNIFKPSRGQIQEKKDNACRSAAKNCKSHSKCF